MPQVQIAQRSKRLSKTERRRQLLDVARAVLEEAGGDRLTLAVLAERAGVSKPIAYDHFETRSGLLLALLEDSNRYYESDAEAKIEAAPQTLPAIAEIVARAYVLCSLDAGPAVAMLSAAIEADADARLAGRAFKADHATQFKRAFGRVLTASIAHETLLYAGLVAAANAICDQRLSGDTTTEAAIEALTHFFVTSLGPFERPAQNRRTVP